MSDDRQPLGALLDGLGIKAAIDDDELVASAIVLLKVHQPDHRTRLAMAYSEGLGWIERAGMLRVAEAHDMSGTTGRRSNGD